MDANLFGSFSRRKKPPSAAPKKKPTNQSTAKPPGGGVVKPELDTPIKKESAQPSRRPMSSGGVASGTVTKAANVPSFDKARDEGNL